MPCNGSVDCPLESSRNRNSLPGTRYSYSYKGHGLVFELLSPGSEFGALPGEAAVLISRLLEEPLDRTSISIFLTTDDGHDSWNVIGYCYRSCDSICSASRSLKSCVKSCGLRSSGVKSSGREAQD
jgi:hypothetical protein